MTHPGAKMQNATQLCSFLLSVSPIIVTSVGQVSCRIGASAVFPCKAVGILPITYNWTKGRAETESPISFNEGKHIDGESKVRLGRFLHFAFHPSFSPSSHWKLDQAWMRFSPLGFITCYLVACVEDGALHISSVQYYDAGEYYCTAENRAGRHQRRTILTVTGTSPSPHLVIFPLFDGSVTNTMQMLRYIFLLL